MSADARPARPDLDRQFQHRRLVDEQRTMLARVRHTRFWTQSRSTSVERQRLTCYHRGGDLGHLPFSPRSARTSLMPNNAVMRELFDRWERVWHEGQYDLIPSCVGSDYIRHDENGDRSVTREAYAEELASVHKGRPGIRVVVYDHSFTEDRARFRFSFQCQTQRPARRRAGPECKVTVSRTACWSRLGSRCDHLARHGRTLHRNAGRVRRSKLARSPSSGDNIGLERPYPFGEELWLAESDFAVG
jgi:hypothetical protein